LLTQEGGFEKKIRWRVATKTGKKKNQVKLKVFQVGRHEKKKRKKKGKVGNIFSTGTPGKESQTAKKLTKRRNY